MSNEENESDIFLKKKKQKFDYLHSDEDKHPVNFFEFLRSQSDKPDYIPKEDTPVYNKSTKASTYDVIPSIQKPVEDIILR